MNKKSVASGSNQVRGIIEKRKKRSRRQLNSRGINVPHLNGHNGQLTGHNGHGHNGHNGHNGKKLNGHGLLEAIEPIKIDSEIVAVLMELKVLREAGHSSMCQCRGCSEVVPRALRAGLMKAVYADVYRLKPEDYLGTV